MSWWEFWKSDEDKILEVIEDFPSRYPQIQADWAKFKLGFSRGAFSPEEVTQLLEWYRKLPEMWSTIRPSWVEPNRQTGMVSTHRAQFAKQVDAWMEKLNGERTKLIGLGFPFLAVGVWALITALTIEGAVWVFGYWKEQENMEDLIEARTAGKITEAEFEAAVKRESDPGIFGNLADITSNAVPLLITGTVLWLFGPQIKAMFASRGK